MMGAQIMECVPITEMEVEIIINQRSGNLKIAICADSNILDGMGSKRYARSDYFAIYDEKTLQFTFIKNEAKKESSGAGNKATKILGDHGVHVLLAPKVGPKAFDMLKAFDIEVYQYETPAKIKDILDGYIKGRFPEITQASAQGHQ